MFFIYIFWTFFRPLQNFFGKQDSWHSYFFKNLETIWTKSLNKARQVKTVSSRDTAKKYMFLIVTIQKKSVLKKLESLFNKKPNNKFFKMISLIDINYFFDNNALIISKILSNKNRSSFSFSKKKSWKLIWFKVINMRKMGNFNNKNLLICLKSDTFLNFFLKLYTSCK